MPPWNAAGTRVSSASVTAAGNVSVRCPAVPKRVASRIEPLRRKQQRRLALHPAPERKLLRNAVGPRMRRQPLRPIPERRPPRRQRHRLSGRDRLPGRRKVRHQDPPRHAVDRKMMDRKPQPPGPLRPGIEPQRLHHHAGRRTEPPLRGFRLRGDQLAQRRIVDTADIDPPQAGARRNRTGRHHLKPPLRIRSLLRSILRHQCEPQPQRVVMIEHRRQAPPSDAPAKAPPAPAAASTG